MVRPYSDLSLMKRQIMKSHNQASAEGESQPFDGLSLMPRSSKGMQNQAIPK